MIYLENNQNIQDVWIPRQEVNQTAFTRYASEEYVDNAIANETARTENTYAKKTDLTAYTPTEDFATINGSAITQGGNIVIETGGNYSAGTNIQIEDDVISVTGITVPTSNTAFTNDAGYITEDALSGYSTTEQVNTAIENATSGLQETLVSGENIKTINNESILGSGNITIQGGNYSAGTNIQIEDDVISVTGITVPTKVSDLENDSGFITSGAIPTSNTAFTNDAGYITTADTQDFVTSGDVKTQIEGYGYITENALSGYSTTEEMNTAIDNATSGKADTSALTAYYTSAQTDTAISNATSGFASTTYVDNSVSGKADSSAVTADIAAATAATTGWVESQGYITEHQSLSGLFASVEYVSSAKTIYFFDKNENQAGSLDATAFIKDGMVDDVYISGDTLYIVFNSDAGKETIEIPLTDIFNPDNYYTKDEVDSAITAATSGLASQTWVENQGYLTGYTETEPIFTGSPAYGITSQDITNWNAVTGLTIPTSNTAFTNDAGYITEDALSGYASTSALTPIQQQIDEVEDVTSTALNDLNDRVDEISGNSVTTGTVQSMITAATDGLASETYVDNAVSGKQDTSAMTAYYTSGETDTAISNATSGLQETLVSGTNIKTINNESILGSGNITIQGGGGAAVVDYNPLQVEFQPAYSYIDYYELVNSGTTRQYKGTIAFDTINGNTIFHSSDNDKVNWTIPTSGDIQTQIDSSISGKVDTSAMTAYYTSAQTNTAITAATQHMVTSISDSVIHIESVTQAEYDAMESGGTLDMNTLYVIKSN